MSGPALPERFAGATPLGEGTSGRVWRAFDAVLGREVAVKVTAEASPALAASLKAEFRVAQDLVHPGLVVPWEVLVVDDGVLVVQPLVAGVPLDVWVAAPAPAARWARLRALLPALVDALAALHAAGLCHGDLKPANVLVEADGSPRLVDFGLARDLRREGAGSWGGSPGYLAPEIMAGDPPSPAGDLYALGATVQELVSGRPRGAADAWSSEPVLPPGLAGPGDPGEALGALLRAEPEGRGSAAALLRALGGAPPAEDAALVGRGAELAALLAAGPGVARVEGESGIGKTALLRALAARLPAGARALWGRAHALDRVPYNALDDVLHQLAPLVGAVPADVAAVFPAFAGRGEAGEPAAQPEERRRRAYRGVAAAVGRLAAERPLVIVLDDAQWADAPSAELLEALLDGAGPLRVVAAHRPVGPGDDAPLVRSLAGRAGASTLALGPLSSDDAAALWRASGGQGAAPAGVGHPLHLRTAVGAAPGADVASVTAARLAALDVSARRVVEAVALAAEPLARDEVRGAASVAADGVMVDLVRARWLTFAGAGAERVECVHHQIAEIVRGEIGDPSATHRALLAARRASGRASPASLWRHADAGGLPVEAAREAWRAAEQAERSLAFDQAVGWYERAAGGDRPPEELHERHAGALVYAGRGRDAVPHFREAARRAGRLDAARLEAAAAEQEVRAGDLEGGRASFTALLASLGERMPAGDRFATGEATWRRLRSLACGWTPGRAVDAPPDAVVGLEALRKAMTSFAGILPQVTDCLSLRVLDRARALGSRRHLVLALGQEACLEAFVGGSLLDRRADGMLAWVRARCGDDPYLTAYADQCENVVAFGRGQFRVSVAAGGRAIERLRARCPGTEWELAVIASYAHHARWWCGDVDGLARDVDADLAEALRRGDGFSANTHRLGEPALALLGRGDDAEVLARCEAAAAASWPDVPFHVLHYLHALTGVGVHLYRGEPGRARDLLEAAWPRLVHGNVLVLGVLAMHLWAARARVAIACADRRGALKALRALGALRLPQARPLAGLLRACLDEDLAGVAAAGEALADAPLWAAAARWRATGDGSGLPAREPARLGGMLAPGA